MTPHDADVLSSSDPDVPGRRSRRGLVAGLVTVALLAAGATGVALASDNGGGPSAGSAGSAVANEDETPDGAASQAPTDPKDAGDRNGRRFGPGGLRGPGLGGPMGALHGEFVVPKQGGGYQTLLVQRGTVSSVSSSAITVKSEDGFSETYTVNSDTVVLAARDGISAIAKGAKVSVLARKTSGHPTALRIGDLSRWAGMRGGPGHGPGDRDDKGSERNTTPTPSSETKTQSSGYTV
jgi:hypothetical protein